jgi:hypothetical protein
MSVHSVLFSLGHHISASVTEHELQLWEDIALLGKMSPKITGRQTWVCSSLNICSRSFPIPSLSPGVEPDFLSCRQAPSGTNLPREAGVNGRGQAVFTTQTLSREKLASVCSSLGVASLTNVYSRK